MPKAKHKAAKVYRRKFTDEQKTLFKSGVIEGEERARQKYIDAFRELRNTIKQQERVIHHMAQVIKDKDELDASDIGAFINSIT